MPSRLEPVRVSSVRRHLAWLIACTLIPVAGFSAFVVFRLDAEARAASDRRLQRVARGVNGEVDREISATMRTLQALAQSGALAREDLPAFREEAERVLRTQPAWVSVVLATPEGQQQINLRYGPGETIGWARHPEELRQVVEARAPRVGALKQGREPAAAEWAFPVRVPVIREGAVRYVLTAAVSPRVIVEPLAQPQAAEEGELTRTVVDERGIVVLRTRDNQVWMGQPATPGFLEKIRASPEGVGLFRSLEGVESRVAFSRSTLTGWTGAVAVPLEVFERGTRRAALLLGLAGLMAVVVSIAGATLFARRFTRGLAAVGASAEALARGEQPAEVGSPIAELEGLSTSIARSSSLLRERQRELEEAVRARDEFLGLASHELNTPLTSLSLQTRMLQRTLEREGTVPDERVRKFVDLTARQASRLSALVRDMLDISRVSGGKLPLHRETFELGALAREVVSRLAPQLSQARCEVTVRAEAPVTGTWDRDRLEQVLTNLLTNAARYGAGCPIEIRVEARTAGGVEQAILQVRDRGRGIAAADQERIFRKFERAVDHHEVAGLGLGLFIVRELVELHSGTIAVESAPGQGATFTVILPCAAGPAAPDLAPGAPADGPAPGPRPSS